MKKAILAVFLLVLVVAVSYIKAVREQEKVDKSFQLGVKSSNRNFLTAKSEADSLKTKLGQQEVAHAESLLTIDKNSQLRLDSLRSVIDSKEETIETLKKKTAQKTSAQKGNSTEKRHRELLAYYKKRYQSLPGDLTEYEFKVAVSEIRQETAKKYSISVSELNRLRDKYKISF